jgi:predicted metal-dependent hydrolase
MYVYVPHYVSDNFAQDAIKKFEERFARARLKKEFNSFLGLPQIAENLNKRYFGGKLFIKSIEYVTNQESKFGCCDYNKKAIRISYKVASMPDFVRDYVIIHELAHLIEPNHGNSFWEIVNRFKLAERARGFLMAKSLEKTN